MVAEDSLGFLLFCSVSSWAGYHEGTPAHVADHKEIIGMKPEQDYAIIYVGSVVVLDNHHQRNRIL